MTVLAEKDCIAVNQQASSEYTSPGSAGYSVSPDTRLAVLFVSLFALIVLLLQFIFRDLDDNRLLSWQWVMSQQQLMMILLATLAGLVAVYRSCLLNPAVNHELTLLMVVSCLLGVFTWSIPEFMVDSGRYFIHARLFATDGPVHFLSEWGYGINAWTDMPLASVIYGSAFYLFGESRVVVQIINTGLFAGSIFITYLIGKQFWDTKTGLTAAWLMLAIPFLQVQVSQMLVDVPAMFFTALAIYLSIVAVKRSSNGILLLAAAAITFAVLTKYSVVIALTSIVVLPFAFKGHNRARVFKRLILLGLATAVFLALVFYIYYPVLLEQLRILLDYQVPAFQRWQESYASTFFYQVHPFVTLAALASVYFAIRKKELAYLIPVSAICIMLIMGVYRARYLIIVFPLLALIAAFGIQQIRDVVVQRFVARGAVLISIVVTLLANQNFLQNTSAINLANAGRYLNTLAVDSVAAIVLPQPDTAVNPLITLPILDYYTDKTLLQLDVGSAQVTDVRVHSKESPLRFTWEVNDYNYQRADVEQLSQYPVIVLITDGSDKLLPATVHNLLATSYSLDQNFAVADEVFRFQSVVTVYRQNTRNL